ncbi:MAG: putative endoglucanase [Paenibacillaceae bacterium]|jgi:hypothetical protein|nr:putative endoglucanase [Paenibacillaceae bacterium]
MGMQRLRVSDNRRYLAHEDGTPFFWLGDTAWELLHKLNREEAGEYLRQRARLSFTVIQTVALAELDGLASGNAYGRGPLLLNVEGRYDPALPDTAGDYHYWDHVDFVVNGAASLGLYVALLPAWGDKFNLKHGVGPVIFNEYNAYSYGRWLGNRYQDCPNLIWVLGGDRPLETAGHFAVIRAMAEGLKEGDQGRHLMTFHPQGWQSSSQYLHEESWLDFNMIQSGHGERIIMNYTKVGGDYAKLPVKPVIDAEPCYEDIAIGFKPENGYFDASDVRTAAYYAVFSGACGHTYGQHCIWPMATEADDGYLMHWREGLNRPGAAQMGHLRALMESRPYFDRVPDQSLIVNNKTGANYMSATRGSGYAMIYIPNGAPVTVDMSRMGAGGVAASWYDPRNGGYIQAGLLPALEDHALHTFYSPSSGRGNDWVLVLDAAVGK